MSRMYSLTELTGRNRDAGRTVTAMGFEFGRRALVVSGIAAAVSLVPTMIFVVLFGPMALFVVPPIFIGLAFLLVETRTRNGLKVRVYQSLIDKKKSAVDELFICWRPVSESLGEVTITASSAPVATTESTAAAAPFAAPKTSNTRTAMADIMES